MRTAAITRTTRETDITLTLPSTAAAKRRFQPALASFTTCWTRCAVSGSWIWHSPAGAICTLTHTTR